MQSTPELYAYQETYILVLLLKRLICDSRTCPLSDSEVAINKVPSIGRIAKTRFNDQMREMCSMNHGAEPATIRQTQTATEMPIGMCESKSETLENGELCRSRVR